jgi:hypothetical protein
LINYAITETKTDVVTGIDGIGTYAIVISQNGEVGEDIDFVVKNYHTPQTRDIVVVKVWEDQDNQDNVRPTEVIVYLVVDGKETDYIVLNEANNWTGKFEGLNVYSEAEIIKYTVFEKLDTDLYEPVIKETEDGFTITNFYSPKGGEEVPKTGDNIVLYIISLLVSIIGLGYSIYLKKNFN